MNIFLFLYSYLTVKSSYDLKKKKKSILYEKFITFGPFSTDKIVREWIYRLMSVVARIFSIDINWHIHIFDNTIN